MIINSSRITDKTANNKIGNVVRFFRWIIDEHSYVFKHPPFTNDSMFISYSQANGSIGHKLVQSHDARIKTFPKSQLPSENVIVDDGRLRPLPPIEQEALLDILEKSKNTEIDFQASVSSYFFTLSSRRIMCIGLCQNFILP